MAGGKMVLTPTVECALSQHPLTEKIQGRMIFEPPDVMATVKAIGTIARYSKMTRQPTWLKNISLAEADTSHDGARMKNLV